MRAAAVLGVGSLFALLSCGDGSGGGGTGGSSPCVPGAQTACACPGGGDGVQICRADGSGFNTCEGCASGTGAGSTSSGTTATTGSGGSSGTTNAASSSSGGLACPAGATEMNLHDATVYANPPDLADWPITTTLSEVDFRADGVFLNFSKKDGASRWPDVIPPGWDGPLEYTLGLAECINGAWYASAVIEFWYGLDASGGNVAVGNQIAMNWYYDAVRWGTLAGRQPQTGEIVGVFVAAGNLRNITTDDPAQSPVMERSNVVLVPFPDVNGANHAF
jgi:hypothetical protein